MKPYFYLSKKKSNDKKRQKKENRIERFKQQQIKKKHSISDGDGMARISNLFV